MDKLEMKNKTLEDVALIAQHISYDEATQKFAYKEKDDIKRKTKNGYWVLRVNIEGKRYEVYCHHLICYLKVGLTGVSRVAFKGSKDDLRFENLGIGTSDGSSKLSREKKLNSEKIRLTKVLENISSRLRQIESELSELSSVRTILGETFDASKPESPAQKFHREYNEAIAQSKRNPMLLTHYQKIVGDKYNTEKFFDSNFEPDNEWAENFFSEYEQFKKP